MFVVAIALALGLGGVMPSYTSAAVGEIESHVQIGQIVKGTVVENWNNEIIIKSDEGKRYHVGLHTFSEEQIQAMNISIGASVQIEGEILESFADFYDFAYFVKNLPPGVTVDEIKKLEVLYNKAMALEKEELWEESGEIWMKINQITNPHYLANWEPESFDVYISMFEYKFTTDDLLRLEELYNQWISLSKSGEEKESGAKIDQFYEIVNKYYVEPTFDEYIVDVGITISKVDYPVIKKLYEAARQANIDGDEQLEMDKWQAFDFAMRPYYRAAYPMPIFEEQMAYYDFEVTKEDLSKLRKIYKGIINLEQKGKYEQVDSQWESFYSILEPYFALNVSIPLRASQVITRGKTFQG
ncbi:Cu-amine-oxidN1 domain-containing protein [Sporosarcina sp. ANT_H38]